MYHLNKGFPWFMMEYLRHFLIIHKSRKKESKSQELDFDSQLSLEISWLK